MEIANIFVVNKADRADAEGLYRNLRILAHEKADGDRETPVIKTIATQHEGVKELADSIIQFLDEQKALPDKRLHLLTEKSWQLIQARRTKDISHTKLRAELEQAIEQGKFQPIFILQKIFWIMLPNTDFCSI